MNPFLYVLTTNGLLFVISIVFFKFPPKKINRIYGYRTHKTMQNQQIWDFANTTFNQTLLKYSGISFVAALFLASISSGNFSWQPMVLVMLTIVVSIVKTEKQLSENFTEEGKRKK